MQVTNEMQREFRIVELAFMLIEYANTEEEREQKTIEAEKLHKQFGEKYFSSLEGETKWK